MATKKPTLEELLAETTAKWICPITKQEFDPSDTDAIEKHKVDLLAKELAREKAKEALAAQRAVLKGYKKSLDTCNSVRNFEKLVVDYLGEVGIAKAKPVFAYLSAKNRANKQLQVPINLAHTWNRVCVQITGLTPSAKKALTSYLGMYNTKDNTYFVPDGKGTGHVSNILRTYYKTDGIKLSEEARQRLLSENKEYRQLATKVTELAAVIHNHRDEVREVTNKMEDIRREVVISNHPDDMSY